MFPELLDCAMHEQKKLKAKTKSRGEITGVPVCLDDFIADSERLEYSGKHEPQRKEQEGILAGLYWKIMEKKPSYQPLNEIQLHLLKMFSFTKTEQTLKDLKRHLRDFYVQKVTVEADKYQIDDKLLDEHLRTPYI